MKKKIYFVLGAFPVVSQPFLYNQIMEVMDHERFDVRIIVFTKTGDQIHSAYEKLTDRLIYFPIQTRQRLIFRLKLIIKSSVSLFFRKPIILFRSLNFFKYSRNASNFNYLILSNYFSKIIQPDILHCHFGTTANIIADLKDIGVIDSKILTSFHGMDITVYPKQFGMMFYKRLYKLSELFTGNSQFIISKMIENGCPEERIYKIPECLDTSNFTYRNNRSIGDKFRILTVGRFVEKKGYEYSLRAIALLKDDNVPFIYDIVGDGPLKSDMIELAKELDIMENVNFHGSMLQEELKSYYTNSHLFLLPSVTAMDGDTEGQGLVLQEAQAIGIPVLATLHNGFPDSIIDGMTGFLVPERDHIALYDKIKIFLNDANLCITMGKRGRSFVQENFDSKVVVSKLIKLYERLLN